MRICNILENVELSLYPYSEVEKIWKARRAWLRRKPLEIRQENLKVI